MKLFLESEKNEKLQELKLKIQILYEQGTIDPKDKSALKKLGRLNDVKEYNELMDDLR